MNWHLNCSCWEFTNKFDAWSSFFWFINGNLKVYYAQIQETARLQRFIFAEVHSPLLMIKYQVGLDHQENWEFQMVPGQFHVCCFFLPQTPIGPIDSLFLKLVLLPGCHNDIHYSHWTQPAWFEFRNHLCRWNNLSLMHFQDNIGGVVSARCKKILRPYHTSRLRTPRIPKFNSCVISMCFTSQISIFWSFFQISPAVSDIFTPGRGPRSAGTSRQSAKSSWREEWTPGKAWWWRQGGPPCQRNTLPNENGSCGDVIGSQELSWDMTLSGV